MLNDSGQAVVDFLGCFPGHSKRFITFTWKSGTDDESDYGRQWTLDCKVRDLIVMQAKVRHYFRVRSRKLSIASIVLPFAPTASQMERGTAPHFHCLVIDDCSMADERWKYADAMMNEAKRMKADGETARIEPRFINRKARGGSNEIKGGGLGRIYSVAYDPTKAAAWYCAGKHEQYPTYEVWNRKHFQKPDLSQVRETRAYQTLLSTL